MRGPNETKNETQIEIRMHVGKGVFLSCPCGIRGDGDFFVHSGLDAVGADDDNCPSPCDEGTD